MKTKKHIYCILLMSMLFMSVIAAIAVNAQVITDVYYFDAQQGMWYAINTAGNSYRVFYIDASGNTVFIATYRWDIDNNYIIFQSPCSCRLYLRRESYTLSTLNTTTWFQAPEDPAISISLSISWNALFGSASNYVTWTPTINSHTLTITYNGTAVVYRREKTFTWQSTTLVNTKEMTTSLYASASTTYTGTITVSVQPSTSEALYSAFNATVDKAYLRWYDVANNRVGGNMDNVLATSRNAYGDLIYVSTTYTHQPTTTSTSGQINVTTSSSANLRASASLIYNAVVFTARVFLSGTSGTVIRQNIYQKNNNIITASNGNTIYVYDSLAEFSYMQLLATSSSYSYYLYTQQISIAFNETRDVSKSILVPLNTQSISTSIRNPNPAVHIVLLDSWTPAHLINYGGDESFLVFTPPRISNVNGLNISLVYNYPIRYTQPQLTYVYAKLGDVLQLIAVSGSIVVHDTHVYVEGSITLSNYVGSTVVFKVNATASNYSIVDAYAYGNINEYIVIQPLASTLINGSIAIESMLVLYNTITELNYTTTVEESVELKQWTMDKISYTVSGEIVGSWAYRIPIYITLAEFPALLTETGFVFRFELPVGDWIKSGLLSPALEDLIIVDSAMKPCLFYIYRVSDDGKAVVFVRYDNVISSNTIVLYILLKNAQLWGSGRTFSTLATFDGVNVKDFVDDFGFSVYYTYLAYNAMLVTTSKNTNIKLGKTWYDFVAINNTHIYEQHGSTMFWNTSYLGFQEDDEILIYISRDAYNDVLVYRNAKPLTSFKLSEFRAEPAYYVGYKDVKFIARFKMLMHSYAIGQLVGGFEKPQTVVKYPLNTVVNVGGDPWSAMWNLAPFMLLLIILAVVVRLVSGGGGVGTGGGGVKLP